MQLEEYLAQGVAGIVRDALRATLTNPKESAFLSSFSVSAVRAEAIRRRYTAQDVHVPPFLIASITSQCNLHCAGCYARGNHACHDGQAADQLSAAEWGAIFTQAEELGVSFTLLAGGEPLVRRDVVEAAAGHPKILFPVFTNGTLLNEDYLPLFQQRRNLVPVLSIEGDEQHTDARRGAGVYRTLQGVMGRLRKSGLLFGASVTVTTENLEAVTSDAFLSALREAGCQIVFYIEYVPVDRATQSLAPTDRERRLLAARLDALRGAQDGSMLFISFPGDEAASGGCLAAGRGFFHINSHGGAEPCPFSPYSDTSVRETGLLAAIRSPLFSKLRSGACLEGSHSGGCVLFEKEDAVRQILKEETP